MGLRWLWGELGSYGVGLWIYGMNWGPTGWAWGCYGVNGPYGVGLVDLWGELGPMGWVEVVMDELGPMGRAGGGYGVSWGFRRSCGVDVSGCGVVWGR